MERTTDQGKNYTILVTVVALTFLVWTLLGTELSRTRTEALIYFGFGALILELIAVEVPYFGYASLGMAIYFACIIHPCLGVGVASIIAAVGLFARTLMINRQSFWFRVMDLFSTLLGTIVAGIIYKNIYRADPSLPILTSVLSLRSLLAMGCSALTYFVLDFIVSTTAVGLLAKDFQKTWNSIRTKIRFFNFVLFPMAVVVLFAYLQSPWCLLFLLPLFVAMRYTLEFSVQEIVVLDQEELEESLNNAQNELMEYKSRNKQVTEDLQKKVDELSIVYEMGKGLGASINLEATLDVIISIIRKLIVYQSCVIFLLKGDQKGDGRLVAAKYATPPHYKDLLALSPLLKLEESYVNLVIQRRQPLLVPDLQTTEEKRIFKDEKSIMCVPLISKEKIMGVIYVGTTKPGTYNESHLNILTILANSAAIAIESAQLYEEKEQALIQTMKVRETLDIKVRQLMALNEMGQALGSSLKIEDTLTIVAENLQKMVPLQSIAIFFTSDTPEKRLVPKKCITPYINIIQSETYSLNEGVLGWVVTQKKPLLLEDTRDSRLANIIANERSAIIVPMIAEDNVIGTIYVGAASPKSLDEDHYSLVRTVAYQAAMAVKNSELYERTMTLAITDGVTGLYTHRYFQERLGEAISEYERKQKPFSLVMVDTDHFKKYNDTLGHPEGDKVLREIADLLRSYTRESDVICRYGGDEFAIILKETDKENGVRTAERIREAFQFRFHTYPVKITLSLGVASFPQDARTKADLVAAADSALYRSKQGGRNRVTTATPAPRPHVPKTPTQEFVRKTDVPPPVAPKK